MPLEERLHSLTSVESLVLRWLVFIVALVLRTLAFAFSGPDLSAFAVLGGALAITGSFFAGVASSGAAKDPAINRRIAILYHSRTAIDFGILLLAIHYSGATSSPLLLFFPIALFLVVLRIPRQAATWVVASAVLAFAILTLAENTIWPPPFRFAPAAGATILDRSRYDLIVIACLAFSAFLVYYASHGVTASVSSRDALPSQSQLNTRANELAILRQVGQQMASSLDLDSLLDTIALSALRVTDANDVHLFLYNGQTDDFGSGVGVWADGQRKLAVSKPRSNGLCQSVVKTGEPILVEDAAHHPLFANSEAFRWNVKSIGGFPIKKAGQCLGVLNAAFVTQHHFSDDECRMLLALADQAALAINNASLYRQVEQRVAELGALYKINQRVSQSLQPQVLMDEALKAVQEIMQVPIGLIDLLDESRGELELAAECGFAPTMLDELRSYRLKTGEGFAGRVLVTGEPLIIRDAQTDPQNLRVAIRQARVHALVCVPLTSKDRVIGVLEVMRQDSTEFTPADVRLLTAIAQPIAVALDNARLFEEARRQAEQLNAQREIGIALTSSLQLREQLRALHHQVQSLLHPDTFFVALYDEAKQELSVQFVSEEGWELHGPTVPLDAASLSSWIIRNRRPLCIGDAFLDQDSIPVSPRHETRPARSWLGVPLTVQDRVIGILSVQSFRPNVFGQADERFLVSVAQPAALAIENARLYETSGRRSRESELLNQVTREVISTLDLETIFDRSAHGLVDKFGYQFVTIYLLENEELHPYAEIGYDGPMHPLAAATDVAGKVARTGHARLIRNVSAEPDHIPCVPGVTSEIAVPIFAEGRMLGVLDVQDRRIDFLNDDDLRVLSLFSEQIGIAVSNAQLYRSAVESERFAMALGRAAFALSTSTDMNQLMDTVCGESQAFFRAHSSFLWVTEVDNLVIVAGRGQHRAEFLRLSIKLDDPLALVAKVVRTGKPICLNHASEHSHHNSLPQDLFEAEALLAAPLIMEGHAIGALVLADEQNPNRFGTSDMDRIMSFAAHASTALVSFPRSTPLEPQQAG